MSEWLDKHAPWAVFIVLAIAGGIVAHVRAYEMVKVDLTFRQHFWSITRRSMMAGFAGVLVYLAADGWAMRGSPWAYFAAGICGLFSAEFFDLVWRMGTAYLQGRMRIAPADEAKDPGKP